MREPAQTRELPEEMPRRSFQAGRNFAGKQNGRMSEGDFSAFKRSRQMNAEGWSGRSDMTDTAGAIAKLVRRTSITAIGRVFDSRFIAIALVHSGMGGVSGLSAVRNAGDKSRRLCRDARAGRVNCCHPLQGECKHDKPKQQSLQKRVH